MKTTTVTFKEIKKDIMQYVYYEVLGVLVGIPILWGGLVLIVLLINVLIKNSIPLIELITVPLFLWWVFNIVKICIVFVKIQKRKFKVRTDVLIEKTDCEYRRIHGTTKREYIPHRLSFCRGRYDVYVRRYYKWSTINTMNEKDVYSTSCIRDTFTLVELDDKILVVYNHRFFDVQYHET